MLIGEMFKKYRLEKGYNLRGAAKRLNISASYLSDIELGNRQVSVNMLKKLTKLFKLKYSYFSMVAANEEMEKEKKRIREKWMIEN